MFSVSILTGIIELLLKQPARDWHPQDQAHVFTPPIMLFSTLNGLLPKLISVSHSIFITSDRQMHLHTHTHTSDRLTRTTKRSIKTDYECVDAL